MAGYRHFFELVSQSMTIKRKSLMKNLSERIAENKQQNPAASGQNKAVFFALREDIATALKDGWSVKDIWQTLTDEQKVTFSYDTFSRYVRRFIKLENQPRTTLSSAVSIKDGFAFNPSPNKEELV